MELSGLVWGQVAGCCERGNEIHGISFMAVAPKVSKDCTPCSVTMGVIQKYRLLMVFV